MIVVAGALIVLVTGGYTPRHVASDYQREESHAIATTADSALRGVIAGPAAAHPGLSGFHLVTKGSDALLVRLGMIVAAQRSLDIQYYSFQDDVSGKLILEALLEAADRGVRIRILIDDLTIKKSDKSWSLLNAHKNVELRLFNPFATNDQSYISRFGNLFTTGMHFTRRMHNKAFIADNQLAIIGGRNLGDAYFDNNQDFNFRDVDVMAIGDITPRISADFDRFWNNGEAFPFTALQPDKTQEADMVEFRTMLKKHWEMTEVKDALKSLPPLVAEFRNHTLELVWAKAELAADTPAKVNQSRNVAVSKPVESLEELVAMAQHEFIAVSPYFVPGNNGVQWLRELVKRGVKVRVLTNSLASTDVVAVHAGYRRYREEVLNDGIELYEMEPIPGKHPRAGRFASASRVSLHTKLYIIDRSDIVVGTMNLDPRSIELNTEVALIIHSKELAAQLTALFERAISPATSYHVMLDHKKLLWAAQENGQEVSYTHEPKAGVKRSIEVDLYGLLPFEKQL